MQPVDAAGSAPISESDVSRPPERLDHFDSASHPAAQLERWVCGIALILLGLRMPLFSGVTSGYLLAFLLLPVWLPALRLYVGARVLMLVALLAVVAGYLLSGSARAAEFLIDTPARNQGLALLLGTAAGIGVLLWARRIFESSLVALLVGVGMCAGGVLFPPPAGDNPWKYVYSLPVSVLVLAFVQWRRAPMVVVAGATLVLAVVSALLDCRSFGAVLLLTMVFTLANSRPQWTGRKARWGVVALAAAAVGAIVYTLLTTLLVNGYLGAGNKERTIAQIDTSGSLLLGGRPEISATWALMQGRPRGYGFGVVPRPIDILRAKRGLTDIGYDPNNGYVERFMFGGHIELHSIFGDLWSTCGIAGLLFVAVVAVLLVRGLSLSVAERHSSAVLILACCWTFWNLAFSPWYAAAPTLLLAVGLAMTRRVGPAPRASATSSADPITP